MDGNPPPSASSDPLNISSPAEAAPATDSSALDSSSFAQAASAAGLSDQVLGLIPGVSQSGVDVSSGLNGQAGSSQQQQAYGGGESVKGGELVDGLPSGSAQQPQDLVQILSFVDPSNRQSGYWAATVDGQVRMLSAQESSLYPTLVEAFKHARSTNTLPPFNPATANIIAQDRQFIQSQSVTPSVASPATSFASEALPSRRTATKRSYVERDEDDDEVDSGDEEEAPVNLKIKVPRPAAAASASKGKGKELVERQRPVKVRDEQDELESESEEESEDGSEEEEESDGYDGEDRGDKPVRSSTRTTRVRKNLREDAAFESPVKSNKRDADEASDDEGASYEEPSGRRSGRATRPSRKVRGSSDEDELSLTKRGTKRSRDDSEEYVVEEAPLLQGDDALLKLHRGTCEKCMEPPADELLEKYSARKGRGGSSKSRKPNKRRDEHEDDIMSDGEAIQKMGGWIECENCCVAAHFGCLSEVQKTAILKKSSEYCGEKIRTIEVNKMTTFLCGKCSVTTHCFSCGFDTVDGHDHPAPVVRVVPPPAPDAADSLLLAGDAEQAQPPIASGSGSAMEGVEAAEASAVVPGAALVDGAPPPVGAVEGDVVMQDGALPAEAEPVYEEEEEEARELLFRCFRCKRGCHYAHLIPPINEPEWDYSTPDTPVKLAEFYQYKAWTCHDCYRWTDDVDKIIAWRPSPADAVEKKRKVGEVPAWKDPLPREYLVKWKLRGFRHTEWVPHAWLQANSQPRLRNFLATGSQLQLLIAGAEAERGDGEGSVADLLGAGPPEERRESTLHKNQVQAAVFSFGSTPVADPDAQSRLPDAWKTFDRILDVYVSTKTKGNKPKKGVAPAPEVLMEEDELVEEDPRLQGVEPYLNEMVQLDEWEKKNGKLSQERAPNAVVWCYVKCGDLPYSEATWDTPPLRANVAEYDAYKKALNMYLTGREVLIPVLTKQEALKRDSKNPASFKKLNQQPSWMAGGKLMPFQLDGVNWLTYKWWELKSCILADDMGLGKTVQIAALVGVLGMQYKTYPALIVVPNSTVTNWVREFEKWVPHIRVVPYHGEKNSRAIIEEFELFHKNTRQLKAHAVITTYDIITSASFKVLQEIPRWEMLVVDEGQRLKSDTNLIFQRLKILNCRQKVLLTGTPLNNNMRELFNLLSFLDPDAWADLERLEREFENLDTEKVQQLHEKLQPYFLRRIKADVLKLPPKHEIILPISLSKLQREQYKALMLRNAAMIQELSAEATAKVKTEKAKKTALGSLNNLMMQLRKTCQHPYLVQPELEDRTVDPLDAHTRMTDASAKLTLLKLMLPRLRAKGHRVLLFSQFKIALDIIQDWLDGENLPYIRLDGDTAQAQRQKDMDRFNAPGSDLFMYLLSTRAGGVGVNLATADTVIVFDPDFNPHQDLQAIARAYRFGQKKKVLVFKFMIKDTVEEKIFQKGRKKMVLDHLIVQNMSKEEDTDVQSMITFGARALFEEDGGSDITYTGQDVDALITRVEETEEEAESEAKGMSFGFAKIWEASKDPENPEAEGAPAEDPGFWDSIVQRAAVEKAREEEAMGRGAQRNRKRTQYAEAPNSPTRRGRDSESPFSGSESENSDDSDSVHHESLSPDSKRLSAATKRTRTRKSAYNTEQQPVPEPTHSDPKLVLRAMDEIGKRIKISVALSPLLHEATNRNVHPDRRRALFDQAVTMFVPAMHLYSLPTDAFSPHYPSVVRYLRAMPYVAPAAVASLGTVGRVGNGVAGPSNGAASASPAPAPAEDLGPAAVLEGGGAEA